jgi:hypothetical protein
MNSNHGSKRGWERSRSSAPLLIGVYPVSAMAGFELSPAHRSGAPLAHRSVGFIAFRTTGRKKRPNPKVRPHDRLVARVGARVASQRCPILRAGWMTVPTMDRADQKKLAIVSFRIEPGDGVEI